MFELAQNEQSGASLLVIGVGGGGSNAVQHMVNSGTIQGVEFACANTDAQALQNATNVTTMQLGVELTNGLGAGANPDIGKRSAQEDREKIYDLIKGTDLLFITAGMGGGTGTGAAPVFAEVAKELGILTVAVITKPFAFEGQKRLKVAEQGIAELSQHVDSLITIPNNKLLSVLGKSASLLDAFKAANEVLQGAVEGISDLITRPGLINVDFADVRTVMSEMGMAMMGTGEATGEERAKQAAELAVSSPLLDDIDLSGAKGVLVNLTAGSNMTIGEFEVVGDTVRAFTSDDATVVVGTVIDMDLQDEMKVTVVVTGLNSKNKPEVAMQKMPGLKKAMVSQAPQQTDAVDHAAGSAEPSRAASRSHVDYQSLSRPTLLRNQMAPTEVPCNTTDDIDYLDIPTFLRQEKAEHEEQH